MTPRARYSIRRWFARSDRSEWEAAGREAVSDELRSEGLKASLLIDGDEMRAEAEQFSRADLDQLFEAVGKGDGAAPFGGQAAGSATCEARATACSCRPGPLGSGARAAALRRCARRRPRRCAGAPGPVLQPGTRRRDFGFLDQRAGHLGASGRLRQRGELATASGARPGQVEWDESWAGEFAAALEVRGLDRNRLLLDVVQVVSGRHDLSIASCDTFVGDDQVAVMQFEVEVGDPILLDQLLAARARCRRVRCLPHPRRPRRTEY